MARLFPEDPTASWEVIMGSDAKRDSMFLALAPSEDAEDVAEIHYGDDTGEMSVLLFAEVPLHLLEALISQAKRRLPPSSAVSSPTPS